MGFGMHGREVKLDYAEIQSIKKIEIGQEKNNNHKKIVCRTNCLFNSLYWLS